MEENANELLEDFKKEEKIYEQDFMSEMDNFDLNSLFTFGINFDMLKLIINNLIKANHRLNCKLSELKLDKINSEQRADKIELALIDLQIANEQSYNAKTNLLDRKTKLSDKNYDNDKDILLREKEYYSNSLNNLNKNDSYKIDKILNNISKFKMGGDNKGKSNEELTKKLEEINNKIKKEFESFKVEIENFKNKINNDISIKIDELSTKLEDTKSRMISNDKEFLLMKKTVQNTEEKIENKFSKELPDYVENVVSNKLSIFNTKFDELEEDNEKKLKRLENNLKDNINTLQKSFLEKNEDIDNKIFKLKTTDNVLSEKLKKITEEKLKEFVLIKNFDQYQTQLEEKMLSDKKEMNAEMEGLNTQLTNLKNQVNEFISDKTDHNNLVMLLKKFETAQNTLYRANSMMVEFEKEKKRLQNLDPKKVVLIDTYEEFKSGINKQIANFHKEFQEVKTELIDKNAKFIGSQATLKDLKNLEDDLISKLDELYNGINDRFADKNLIIKNNKIMELKIKHYVENYKKSEKSDTWLLAKMPMGHLCASCEAYLGDIKENANSKYVPWNKYPTKDAADKLYRVGAGYSRMLQMISPDKNKYKGSVNNGYESLSPIGKRQDSRENVEEKNKNINMNNSSMNGTMYLETNSNKVQNKENKMIQAKFKLPNLLKVKHLKKNSTFSNFYSDNLDEPNKGNKINNNSGLNFSSIGFNFKNKDGQLNKNKNEDFDGDEIIHSPNTAERKSGDEEEKRGPTILKVIKKK